MWRARSAKGEGAKSSRAVGLNGFENYYPHQLSGGMQKRASIARILIYGPELILMDEPFGALDAQTRMLMQYDLQHLWNREGSTIVFVTHDLTERFCSPTTSSC